MSDSLLKELSETQLRRHKLDKAKIAFITALLGFGSIKFPQNVTFYQVLYLVPLVSIFFDLLVMGEQFSIRRIGAFLRLSLATPEIEKKWQLFVSKKRDKFFKYGSRGFTVLSYIVSIALLFKAKGHSLSIIEYLWFAIIIISYLIMLIWANKQLKDLDKMQKEDFDKMTTLPVTIG